ncbi:xanthine dehydrogenase family protein molybdopterin-binding subunit [Mucilaginibacter arboris]|uniref:Molybdopterin-dependent oxidoreductase n=1 Tax=Mucilaginibacter arboris TaxID=2682090 RepID=A0A7K1SX32_9SPHI|nr:xanthine dehydrogenase family protein molybdopterin-binding subunit [Mucilaginibacter arboris]MVN21895.1 molybdopterin-dependent oxidoreductase [Mucilaginibacter arboris]
MSDTVGKPIDRVDGRLKVTGGAKYSAEFDIKNMLYGVAVTSNVTKGRIKNINTSIAEKSPGVVGVMTYKNSMQLHSPSSSDPGGGKFAEKDLMPLQNDRIFYDGQIIAVVMAETFEQAEHAATLVKVDYQTEDPIFDLEKNIEKAYKPASASTGSETQVSRGNADDALKTASLKVEQTYTTPVYHHNAMEPHATIALWQGETVMFYDSTQSVAGTKSLMSSMLGVPKEKVRVISYFIGGGFGSKGFSWPNTVLTAMAAKLVNRPVKLVLSRQQMFTTAGRRSQTIQKVSLGADQSGKLSAIKHDNTVESSFVDEFVETAGVATSMIYSSPNVDVSHKLVRLNKVTPCPMRAPGEAPGMYALEVAMDELAYQSKIDPVQLRLVNYAEEEEQKHKKFSSKYLRDCYQKGADLIGWSKRNQQPASMKEGKYLVGYGMATATYPANRSASSAKAVLFADGHAEIMCATQDIGTGTYTIMTQTAADALGLPIEKVIVKLGDSEFPKGANSGGSQVTASVGPAIRAASLGAISKLVTMAVADPKSPLHGQKEVDVTSQNGRIFLAAKPDQGESYTQILSRNNLQKIEAQAITKVSTRQQTEANPAAGGTPEKEIEDESKTNQAVQLDEKLDRKPFSFHSFGAHFVKVLVDPDLGTVRVDKAVAVMDIGTVMNEKTAKNQIMGGMIFGIGMALMEETNYDPNRGRPVTKDLANYLVPVNADMPDFQVEFINKADNIISPIGARGIGEIGITGITAAVNNAIYHATGKRIRELPVTPDKLL